MPTDLKISQFADGGAVQPTDEVAANRLGVNTKVFFGTAAGLDVGPGPDDIPTNETIPATIANTLQGVSETSNSISVGSKSFVTDPMKSFETGRSLLITSDGAPSTRRMTGIVTDYDTVTGELDITIQSVTGSGIYSDWTIRVSGDQGPEGPEGPEGPAGTGAVDSVNGKTGTVSLDSADVPHTPGGGSPLTGTDVKAALDQIGLLGIKGQNLDVALNFAKGTNIASAATTDIGAATGNYVLVTGTTTITALGTIQAGTIREVVFGGILILTHNATSLILPTGANITTAAGDTATFVSEGSGNWRCTQYQRANGQALAGGNNVASTYFSASRSSSGNVSSGNDIVFDTEQVDVGNNYNNATGVFTAPATGVYLATYLTTSQNTTVVQLQKNGSMYDQVYTYNNAFAISKTVVVSMNSGDTLKCRCTAGTVYGTAAISGAANGFSVVRLT